VPTCPVNDPDLPDTPHRYHPFYCEENAWWLCADAALGGGPHEVLFVLSRFGACPVAEQRAVAEGALCWWDYHVVVMDASGRVWDLDSRLGYPVPAGQWLRRSFPFAERLPAALQPVFRRVPAARYRAEFASDRSHMRDADGGWLHPPPPWPPIGDGMRLSWYRGVDERGPGELLSLEELQRHIDDG
jgi:hypothetical protein